MDTFIQYIFNNEFHKLKKCLENLDENEQPVYLWTAVILDKHGLINESSMFIIINTLNLHIDNKIIEYISPFTSYGRYANVYLESKFLIISILDTLKLFQNIDGQLQQLFTACDNTFSFRKILLTDIKLVINSFNDFCDYNIYTNRSIDENSMIVYDNLLKERFLNLIDLFGIQLLKKFGVRIITITEYENMIFRDRINLYIDSILCLTNSVDKCIYTIEKYHKYLDSIVAFDTFLNALSN